MHQRRPDMCRTFWLFGVLFKGKNEKISLHYFLKWKQIDQKIVLFILSTHYA